MLLQVYIFNIWFKSLFGHISKFQLCLQIMLELFKDTAQSVSCAFLLQGLLPMFSKSKLVSERSGSDRPDKRLRRNVSDSFLSGAISAGRAATLFQDAGYDGAQGVADLAVHEGKKTQIILVRKPMKDSKWPPLYEAKIPLLHQKTHQVLEESIHLLLPHEVLARIMYWNKYSKGKVFDRARLSASATRHF